MRGFEHTPQSSTEVKGRVELYIYSPSGPSWQVIGRTYCFFVVFNDVIKFQEYLDSAVDEEMSMRHWWNDSDRKNWR
jgi:hypothetical protein